MSPLFKYHARDVKGVDKDSTIDAWDEACAVKTLQEQGLVVISIEKAEFDKQKIVSDKEIKRAIFLEYRKQSRYSGCLPFFYIIAGVLLLIIPIIGLFIGIPLILAGFLTFISPVNGQIFIDKIFSRGAYELIEKQVKFKLESGEPLLIKCPICNKEFKISPNIYYGSANFRCTICNEELTP